MTSPRPARFSINRQRHDRTGARGGAGSAVILARRLVGEARALQADSVA